MSLGLALDGVLAVLLVATIAYCAILHRQLARLRSSTSDMHHLMTEFAAATERAERGIAELGRLGADVGGTLQARTAVARELGDELQIMTEAGSRLADRLERDLADRGDPTLDRDATSAESVLATSEAERELQAALRQGRSAAGDPTG
jgi:hypothetical protein